MSVTPTGRLSKPLHQLRDLLTSSAAWISWIGASVTPGNRVAIGECPASTPRPYAIIYWDANHAATRDGARVGDFVRTGSIALGIVADVTDGSDDIDAETDFLNHLDAVMADLEHATNSGGDGLTINGWAITDGPMRIPIDQRKKHGDRMMVEVSFDVEIWP